MMFTLGTVKWFNNAKGFGFIQPDDNSTDVFAHFSAINMDGFRTLKAGARVRFELSQGEKGAQALNIQMLPKEDLTTEQSSLSTLGHSADMK